MSTTCLIYVRISRDKAGAGLGVGRQETDCRALADRLGWTVLDVLADNDISAYTGKARPAYRELLRRLEDGEASGVVAWHTDRLHRSPVELEAFVDVCDRMGVATHTVSSGPLDLSTPSGRMVARMLGASARYEVEHNVERIRAARLRSVEKGEWGGGRRPFGYEADGVTVRESEAREVAAACEAVAAGRSMRSLMADLNRRGVRTSTGARWEGPTLRKVLLNPRNVGWMVHRGKVVGDAVWPAIVSEDVWRACRAVLSDEGRVTNRGRGRRFLGGGLFVCVCGERVVTSADGRGGTSYVCPDGKHVVRRCVYVDRVVETFVLARLSRPDVASLTRPAGADVSGLRVQVAALRGRLDEAARMFADGLVDGRQLAAMSGPLMRQLEDAEGTLGRSLGRGVLSQFDGADPADVWGRLDVESRRQVVAELATVTLHPGQRGRPKGWQPGEPYFDPSTVQVAPRSF